MIIYKYERRSRWTLRWLEEDYHEGDFDDFQENEEGNVGYLEEVS